MNGIAQPPVAVTAGDPAGIGPDIVLALARRDWPVPLVAIADRDCLAARAARLGMDLHFDDYRPGTARAPSAAGRLCVYHRPLPQPVNAGTPDPGNAPAVLDWLRCAVRGCEAGDFAAMVTAPVSKAVIADSGTPFSGHTEYLAQLTGCDRVVMLLAAGELRVALATTHLPLSAVPAAITRESLRATLRILHAGLRRQFGLEAPRIAVLGLNPHAGESGRLGREEIDTIAPVIGELRGEGLELHGPLPADTAFAAVHHAPADAYLAMYHDQGLPVLKYAGFGHAVNITLGLPIIRSSVDHGTAFDIAGSGRADPESLFTAVESALDMAARRRARQRAAREKR